MPTVIRRLLEERPRDNDVRRAAAQMHVDDLHQHDGGQAGGRGLPIERIIAAPARAPLPIPPPTSTKTNAAIAAMASSTPRNR